MKNIAIPILIAVIFLVMVVYLVTFQVRETESAFVTRFGKPVGEAISKPGLYFKWPAPIEQVHKFDSRMRVLEAELTETTTSGTVPIIVNTYVVWRVAEPLKFLNAVKTIENAELKLRSQINDTQNRVIGQHAFGEFVNSDPDKIKFDTIQAQMLADLQGPALKDYGIEIKTLGMKQLKINAEVTKQVFERMKAERQRRTEATISEGGAEAGRIRAEANLKSGVLLAAAEARAKTIRGEGDAAAAQYYKMLEEDPQLAIFLRNIEAFVASTKQNTTIIIPADADPFRLLMGMPSLQPSKPARKP